jgi:hypothetical protein
MTRIHLVFWSFAFLVCAAGVSARPQDIQFLPEVNAHLTLNSTFRVYLQAKDDREGGDPRQATIGPSLQLYRKPLVKLKKIKSFDLDDAKSRFLVLEAGYRYITAPDAPSENRMQVAVTSNFPLRAGFTLSERNRADLDWKSRIFTWRYRNWTVLLRSVPITSSRMSPSSRSTRVSTASGAPRRSTRVACSPRASMFNSAPTMSTTITRASVQTGK